MLISHPFNFCLNIPLLCKAFHDMQTVSSPLLCALEPLVHILHGLTRRTVLNGMENNSTVLFPTVCPASLVSMGSIQGVRRPTGCTM